MKELSLNHVKMIPCMKKQLNAAAVQLLKTGCMGKLG